MPFINDMLAENKMTVVSTKVKDQQSNPEPFRSRFLFEPKKVMNLLRSRIIGQDDALDEIEKMLIVIKAGISDADRPLSVNLLMGPTGVGKTETVRLLCQGIYGKNDAFCRIDMNTLSQEHYAAALTGAPPGYVGSKEGTTLFDIEKISGTFSKPGIVLFDELEKASKEVIRSLLNVIDNGRLVLSSGNKTIDFRNSIIFMTSNIGVKEVERKLKFIVYRFKQQLFFTKNRENQLLIQALKKKFDPEFINRIDRTLIYNRITVDKLPSLLEIELSKLRQRLEKYQLSFTITPECCVYLCSQYDNHYGARDLARTLRTKLEPELSEQILLSPDKHHFIVDVCGKNIEVRSV